MLLPELFAGFEYVGSYPGTPLLKVDYDRLMKEPSEPRVALHGPAYVYRKASTDSFEKISKQMLPDRLKALGWQIEMPWFKRVTFRQVTEDFTWDTGARSIVIEFGNKRCGGLLWTRFTPPADEVYVLQMTSSCN